MLRYLGEGVIFLPSQYMPRDAFRQKRTKAKTGHWAYGKGALDANEVSNALLCKKQPVGWQIVGGNNVKSIFLNLQPSGNLFYDNGAPWNDDGHPLYIFCGNRFFSGKG